MYESLDAKVLVFSNVSEISGARSFLDTFGRRCASSSSIWNIDVIPPDALTGLGDFTGSSSLGLTTMGSGRLPYGLESLEFRSKRSTSEVVGAIGVESVLSDIS